MADPYSVTVPHFDPKAPPWWAPSDVEARNRLVCQWAKLVARLAWKFSRNEYARAHYPFEDVFQDGILSLMKAIEHFDPDMGIAFSTYATHAIRNNFRRTMYEQGLIPLGVKAAERTMQKTTPEQELDERFQSVIRRAYRAIHVQPLPEDKRLHPITNGDKEPTYQDELEALRKAMADLRSRDADVIRQRFGLDGNGETTLAEIGERQGVTRQRAQQIERRAMNTLRNWLCEKTPEQPVARSKVFRTQLKPHPIDGTAQAVAPEMLERPA